VLVVMNVVHRLCLIVGFVAFVSSVCVCLAMAATVSTQQYLLMIMTILA
jgi:hypothetical protein